MNAPSCPRCHRTYDEQNRTPRILPKCGHTFCQDCLQKMKIYGAIQCPTDNETSKVGSSSVTSLVKNMALLDLVKNSGPSGSGSSGSGGGGAHLVSLSLWVLPEKLELGRKIGEGNFGEVREAMLDDAGHKCKVAVKL
ncbi:hypothetical protein CBR_g22350 [Chara braunii]|uniref:RING-type domain-containing protein n=1 Tax=Chara braunii TaxID=69332 RepID=A0A388JUW9_CHABU|nr:hypothetical protein CBR_g22350 [Chara braunii]|eukprot:GBG61553.1 hypothetical protein CBR_g22350 [Chara braunii]